MYKSSGLLSFINNITVIAGGATVAGFAVGFNVGATVVGATVVGATVVGAAVVGAMWVCCWCHCYICRLCC